MDCRDLDIWYQTFRAAPPKGPNFHLSNNWVLNSLPQKWMITFLWASAALWVQCYSDNVGLSLTGWDVHNVVTLQWIDSDFSNNRAFPLAPCSGYIFYFCNFIVVPKQSCNFPSIQQYNDHYSWTRSPTDLVLLKNKIKNYINVILKDVLWLRVWWWSMCQPPGEYFYY